MQVIALRAAHSGSVLHRHQHALPAHTLPAGHAPSDAQSGEKRAESYCEIAEVYEDRLSDVGKAADWFEKALTADARNMAALKGLERLYAREGKTEGLLKVLEAQVDAVATPRQKVELYNRIGALVEEEFVDHARAAEAYEEVTRLDAANDQGLRGLGRTLRVLGRWDDLANLLERHADQVDEPAKKVELLVAAGRVLIDPIGALDRAQRCFDLKETQRLCRVQAAGTAVSSCIHGFEIACRRAVSPFVEQAACEGRATGPAIGSRCVDVTVGGVGYPDAAPAPYRIDDCTAYTPAGADVTSCTFLGQTVTVEQGYCDRLSLCVEPALARLYGLALPAAGRTVRFPSTGDYEIKADLSCSRNAASWSNHNPAQSCRGGHRSRGSCARPSRSPPRTTAPGTSAATGSCSGAPSQASRSPCASSSAEPSSRGRSPSCRAPCSRRTSGESIRARRASCSSRAASACCRASPWRSLVAPSSSSPISAWRFAPARSSTPSTRAGSTCAVATLASASTPPRWCGARASPRAPWARRSAPSSTARAA